MHFNFQGHKLSVLSSNIPSWAYGVLFLNLYDTPGLASYECFILRAMRCSKLLKQGYLVKRLKSSFRKFYGRYGDLVENARTLSRMLNDILTLDQQWLPYRWDFPPISWPLYELDLHRNVVSKGAFARGVASQGNAYPSGHLVPSPILGLANAPIVETKFLELAMSLLDSSPRIPLGTLSILLIRELNQFVSTVIPCKMVPFHV